MNTLRNVMMSTTVAMLLGSGSVWAQDTITQTQGNQGYLNGNTSNVVTFRPSTAGPDEIDYTNNSKGTGYAPEIDATSGPSAITLLSGTLVLAWRRSRSRLAVKSS